MSIKELSLQIEDLRSEPDDHKDYENNYEAGRQDACNRILGIVQALQATGEGPSDEEVDAFVCQWWELYGKGHLPNSSDKALVAAALARWGRPVSAGGGGGACAACARHVQAA
jgi:hypothetical protein